MSMSTTEAGPGVTKSVIGEAEFQYLRDLIREKSGIELDDKHQYLVESRLPPVAGQHGLDDVTAVVLRLLQTNDKDLEVDVIDAMTTNETSFFRDHHPFTELTNHVIPELLEARAPGHPLTIWCAASSSGQEPYTLAMLLNEGFPELVRDKQIRILATDLSRTMVKRTAEGRYSQFEVNRGLPAKLLLTYFEQEGRDWLVRKDLRDLIQTDVLNLLGSWPSVPRCDLVLLRNVLIYFSLETKQEILRRIRTNVLRPGGYLMLGSSEMLINVDDKYEKCRRDNSSCYRPDLEV